MKKDKTIQSGKVLVTCVVTIPGIGTHSGSGEEWADDENAMTSAEAQAFKRACSCFGLGRYFYNFAEMWVDLNEYKQPKQQPKLPSWALPVAEKRLASRERAAAEEQRPTSQDTGRNPLPKGPLDAGVTEKIASCKSDLGTTLYSDILERVARVRSPRDIANQKLQQVVLRSMEVCLRGMRRIREIAAELPEGEFYTILDDLKVESLDRIPNFAVFLKLANAMLAAGDKSAA
jgi:hypothetical protein